MSRIIDTHQHFLPSVYVRAVGTDALAHTMPNGIAPHWSAESAIAMMDRAGIAEGILSISAGPPLHDSADLLRACNEAAADLRARFAGRFGSFASLPLPDVDAALAEVAHAADVLRCEGFVLFTNYDGKYLGDAAFRPLLEELDRRGSVVFIHPTNPPADFTGIPSSIIEFPFETTRTAASLILSGAVRDFPRIRFILSHAGGTLPYLAARLIGGVTMNPSLHAELGDTAVAIRSFWFDLALSANPTQIAALRQVAAPNRILFGTDFPMAPAALIDSAVAIVPREFSTAADRVLHQNAADLLGRA